MNSLTILLRRMKHQIVFSLLALLCLGATHAQVLIDQTFSIEEYVNDVLLGAGVTASTSPTSAIRSTREWAHHWVFSLESGLVLSSGNAMTLAECNGLDNSLNLGLQTLICLMWPILCLH